MSAENRFDDFEKNSLYAIMAETEKLAEVGGWEWDIAEDVWTFSDNWLCIHGCSSRHLKSADLMAIAHPDDRTAIQLALDKAVNEGTDYEIEHRIVRQNTGEERNIRSIGKLNLDNDGRAVKLFGAAQDITDRKQAEKTLNRKHRMLARTEDVAHVGSWEWEAEGDKVTWSEELFRIFGLEPMEKAPPFAEHQAFYVPEDRVRLVGAVEDCLKSGIPYDLEVRIRRTDGQLRHCVVRGIPEYGADGVVNRLYGSLHDITEIRRAEERIAILSRMLDAAPACISIHDTDGRFVFANAENVSLHGYDSLNEFLKVNLHELDVPESETLLAERFRKIAEEGEARFEVAHYRKDGSTFPLEVLAKQIDWEGRTAILSIATDITERKRMERQNQVLANIITRSRDFIGVADLNQDAFFVNPAGQALVGLDGDEAVAKTKMKEYFLPEDLPFVESTILPAVMQDGRWTGEFRFRHFKTGEPVPVLYELFLTEDPETGAATNFATITRDITGRKRAEEERERLQEQLLQAQKMESVGRLAGGVAHDFNNMLGVILGHTEMALEQVAHTVPLHADLEEIQKAAQRSADITRQLLAFARKQTIAPKVIDLNETVKRALKMIRRLIGEDIDLVWVSKDSNPWPIKMDPSQIDQVLANLCVNARDAISDVGKITIETGKASFDDTYCADHPGLLPGDFALLAVSDDGCGMDRQTLANLFEPFFTTKDVDKGTGLGLATVYGIVKQNNGFVSVYSEPGQGTTFKIYLPRHAAITAREPEKRPPQAMVRGSEILLLVEDEPSILRMTRMMLERIGYKVLAAGTPREAIALAREHVGEIHLLMTDVIMPEMSGRELAENLLSLYPNIKRLFMSGYTADVIAHHGVLEPGVQFIQKPFAKETLAARVREALDETEFA